MFFTEFPTNLDTDNNLLKTTNRAFGILKDPIGPTDLSFELIDASKFPLGAQIITIENELLACSSRTGNIFTVSQRGFDSTLAVSHIADVKATLNFTSHHWNNLIDAIKNLQSFVLSGSPPPNETIIASNDTEIIMEIPLLNFTDIDLKVRIIEDITTNITKFNIRILKDSNGFYNSIYGKTGTIPETDLVFNIFNDANNIYLQLTNLRNNNIFVLTVNEI